MHKLVWNRMEFPIQQKRKECFRNQNSLLPVFLLQHKYHVHTSLPIPRKKEERPWILPFWWSGMMERISATAWEICYGRSASQLHPSNHQISLWLVIWGAISITKHRSCLFWDYVVEHFPYPPLLIPEGWSKCSIPFVLNQCYHSKVLFQFKWRVRGEERLHWGQRKGDAASSSSPPALSPQVALLTGLCLTTWAGQCWHTLPSFLIGSSNGGEGWGIVSSTM